MLGIVAAVLFFLSFLINAAELSTNDVFLFSERDAAWTDSSGPARGRNRHQLGTQRLTPRRGW